MTYKKRRGRRFAPPPGLVISLVPLLISHGLRGGQPSRIHVLFCEDGHLGNLENGLMLLGGIGGEAIERLKTNSSSSILDDRTLI